MSAQTACWLSLALVVSGAMPSNTPSCSAGGATVVAFGRNQEKFASAKDLGADHVISTKDKSVADISVERARFALALGGRTPPRRSSSSQL
jgi:D-arabinose 1-dehydrogenase-like Zn-dependent alcohol dehydrogenase